MIGADRLIIMASSSYRCLLVRRCPFLSPPLLLYLLLLFLLLVSKHDDTSSVEAIHQGQYVQKQQQKQQSSVTRLLSILQLLLLLLNIITRTRQRNHPQNISMRRSTAAACSSSRISNSSKQQQPPPQQYDNTEAPPSALLFPCLLAASAGRGRRARPAHVRLLCQHVHGQHHSRHHGTRRGPRDPEALLVYAVVTGYVAGVVWAESGKIGVATKAAAAAAAATRDKNSRQADKELADDASTLCSQLPSFLASSIKSSRSWFENTNSNTCLAISPSIALLLADVFTWWNHNSSSKPAASIAALMAQAVAHVVHETASQATGGTVLFAVTGHGLRVGPWWCAQ